MSNRLEITVDESFINRAAVIINDLWDEVCIDGRAYQTCIIKDAVDFVFASGTKTWPYILMTQLLGKATDERASLLSMHKSSGVEGAWDARSLCEHVITRNDGFEATALREILGGVKQPYNNSPGQKPLLSKDNKTAPGHIPVRDAIIDGFAVIRSAEDARMCLGYVLRVCHGLVEQAIAEEERFVDADRQAVDLAALRRFLVDLATQGHGGEGVSLAVAIVMSTVFSEEDGYSVILYPINSSRRSDGAHEDLEIYLGSKKYAAMEIKDKPFAASDVRSAAEKAWRSGFARFAFVYGFGAGPAEFETLSEEARRKQEHEHTFAVCLSAEHVIDAVLLLLEDVSVERIRATTVRLLKEARVMARTQTVARELLRGFLSESTR